MSIWSAEGVADWLKDRLAGARSAPAPRINTLNNTRWRRIRSIRNLLAAAQAARSAIEPPGGHSSESAIVLKSRRFGAAIRIVP